MSGSNTLRRTLESLARCTFPAVYASTIVVENNGPPTANKFISRFNSIPNLNYIHHTAPGKSRARNRALEVIPEGLFFLTDDDVEFTSNVLVAYAQAAQSSEKRAFFGGPFTVSYEVPPPEWLVPHLPHSAVEWNPDPEDVPVPYSGFLGFNWAAYAEDLRDAGGFNEHVGPGSELNSNGTETDMQARLIDSGLSSVYVPEARVIHHVEAHQCTIEWALRRRSREGKRMGMKYCISHGEEYRWVGHYPAWMMRYLLKLRAKKLATPFLSKDVRMETRTKLAWHRGFMAGYRYAAENEITSRTSE